MLHLAQNLINLSIASHDRVLDKMPKIITVTQWQNSVNNKHIEKQNNNSACKATQILSHINKNNSDNHEFHANL